MSRLAKVKKKPLDVHQWSELHEKASSERTKKRLKAIWLLHTGKSMKETADLIGCDQRSLRSWVDDFLAGGLQKLVEPRQRSRTQSLETDQKEQLRMIIMHQTPWDYGYSAKRWRVKELRKLIASLWGADLKKSRIYEILNEIGIQRLTSY